MYHLPFTFRETCVCETIRSNSSLTEGFSDFRLGANCPEYLFPRREGILEAWPSASMARARFLAEPPSRAWLLPTEEPMKAGCGGSGRCGHGLVSGVSALGRANGEEMKTMMMY